jgi:hypothetical protein
VVGIAAAESEFPSGAGLHYDLYATAAFAAAVNHRAALLSTYYVRFQHGAADLAGFDSRVRSLDVYGTYEFVRRQVAAAVCWQATTVALVGIAVGTPIGVAAGRVLWRVFATNFGVVPVPVVQPLLLTALVAGVLAAANMLAAVLALLAARSHPGQLLRTE